jgi:hypothetical protein
MKPLIALALVSAQLLAAAQPVAAAELGPAYGPTGSQMGAFAGARVRLPLDGKRRELRATLTAAPALHSLQANGEQRTRIGQGLELGFEGRETRFDLAGQPVARLAAGGEAPEGKRQGLSTIGAVAIGVGVLLLGLFLLAESCRKGEICGSE